MFKTLKLQPIYTSDDNDIPKEFFNPVMKNAVMYDRTTGYFSVHALAKYSEGLESFVSKNAKYRLVVSHEIEEKDLNEIKQGYALKDSINANLLSLLKGNLSLREQMNLSNLAYYIANGTVEIKIAFRDEGMFHEKCGILEDEEGNTICFYGSNNETEAAIDKNYESFQLTCSWLDYNGFYLQGILKSKDNFEKIWNNKKERLCVLPASDVIINEIIKYNKGKIIVEEKLLKKNAVILDYADGQLILQLNIPDLNAVVGKSFYNMKLRQKVDRIEDNIIYFRSDLVYPDYIKINNLLEKKIPALGFDYEATNRLMEYIEERNLYIESRARLGIELKTDDSKIVEQYTVFKDVVNEQMERELREKQMKDAFFMCAMLRSGNFSVPGSGKTSSALAVFSYYSAKGLVDKIVMIGPKNAFGSWIDEFKACFGSKKALNMFSIQDKKYNSPETKRAAIKYDTGNCNLFLFNYESIINYSKEIASLVSNKCLLVLDEVHKVKAINGTRATVVLEITKCSNYTIAMTGTPIPNSYTDLYNLLHYLYNDEYREFFGFDISFLRDPLPTDIDIINNKIQPFFCRTTKRELMVPDANKDIIKRIKVSAEEQQLFEIVKKKYINNRLALFIRILQLESNPKMLLESLDLNQFGDILDVEGDIDQIDIVDYSDDVRNLITSIELTSKKKECLKLVKGLVNEGKTVIVWCVFKDTIRSLETLFKNNGIKATSVYGEIELENRTRFLDDFKNGKYDVLITNPHTLAESVSLHTVCHDAVYFEYSYNLVHLLQSKDRIHRLGLQKGQYTQYYYLQDEFVNSQSEKYSMDDEVYQRLTHKELVMLKAIDGSVLEPVYTTEEDLEVIFKRLL